MRRLAKRLGVSVGTVTKWLSDRNEYRGDKTRLRNESLKKLAERGDPELRRAADAARAVRKLAPREIARPQLVRWGRNDGLPAGVKVTDPGDGRESFVARLRMGVELQAWPSPSQSSRGLRKLWVREYEILVALGLVALEACIVVGTSTQLAVGVEDSVFPFAVAKL